MIKAEVISHEGNPGPNWLDHCKALITPWTISVAVVIAAVLFVVAVSSQRRDVGQASQSPTSTSTQAAHLNPLAVTSVPVASNVNQATTNASVQASPDSGASQTPSDTTANVLGAKATPSLNTAKNTNNAASSNSAANPNTVSAQQLSKNVQSAVTKPSETVHQTVKAVTGALGL